MSRKVLVVASLAAAFMTAGVYSAEKAAEAKLNLKAAKCVVSGKPVKEASAVDYKGAKVFFCCDNCPKAFKGNTAKFASKANHQLFATGQAKAVKCPLAGRKLNPNATVLVAGAKVALCCNGCKGKVAKAKGDAQIELVFNDKAFAKGFEVPKKKKK